MITVLSYSYSRFDLEEEEEEKNIFNASLREKAERSYHQVQEEARSGVLKFAPPGVLVNL